MGQMNTKTNIALTKILAITKGEYGKEIINLTNNEEKMFNKAMALHYKKILKIGTNAPTKWILWEVNQEEIKEKIMAAKLNYWKRTRSKSKNGLHWEIKFLY